MRHLLVLILVVSVFAGSIICNSAQQVFGLPLFFVWNVLSVFIITIFMLVIFLLDPKNNTPR